METFGYVIKFEKIDKGTSNKNNVSRNESDSSSQIQSSKALPKTTQNIPFNMNQLFGQDDAK